MRVVSYFRLTVGVLLAMGCAACTTSQIKPAARTGWKTIGIVSLMGDEVRATRVSNGDPSKITKNLSTQQLGLHDMGERIVAQQVRRMDARVLGQERAKVQRVTTNNLAAQMFSGRPVKRGALGLEAKRLGRTYGVDAIIALIPMPMRLWDSDTGLFGYEVFQRAFIGNEKTAAFAGQRFEVYDARTGKMVGFSESFHLTPVPHHAWDTGSAEAIAAFGGSIRGNVEEALPKLGLSDGAAGL